LEQDLLTASGKNRLHGILNGCDYSEPLPARLPLAELLDRCDRELIQLIGARPVVSSAHAVASRRIERWQRKLERSARASSPPVLVTSIGRITGQKILLLRQPLVDGRPALEHLLDTLGERGLLILLGSGDAELQRFLATVAAGHDNFIYLQGYAGALSQDLYSSGDLFLMPSSFEPCGISQMLAMRAGQPCLVHSVGGLRDTVQDGKNGFAFAGDNLQLQAQQMVDRFAAVLQLQQKNQAAWQKIVSAAAAARFAWRDAAVAYIAQLYRGRE
ncbi:MAG: glycosyltransferase, partial [Gammaproteobacteria bacterium]|nr:glycosyltransferase [Gammaproteobacteria bacterium]